MIFSFLSRRPEDEQAYAFFLHGTPGERKLAVAMLIKDKASLIGDWGLSKKQLREAVLARSVRDVVERSGLTHHKAWKLRGKLSEVLAPVQNRLMDALWDWLCPQDIMQES
jgi:hypothetical protein